MTRTPASSQDRSSLFLGWLGPLLIVLGLGAAPAWLLAGAIDAAGESREAAREAALGRQLESCLDAVAPLVAPAYRWGRLLDRLAQRAKAHPDPVAWLARAWPRFVRRWQAPMVATVFARDGRTLWRTTPWSVPASEARALVAGLQIRATGRFRPFHHPPHQALFAAMRRLLGHQILPDTLYMALPFNPRMVQASVQSAWPYLWFAAGEDHVLLVQARAEAMTDARSLRSWLAWLNDRRPAGHPRFGLLENGLEHWPGAPGIGQPSSAAVAPATFFANRPLSPSWWPPPPGAARAALATAQAALETRIRSGHHLFGFRQVAPRRWLIGVMPLGPTSPPRRGPDPADLPWLARLAGTIWSLLVGIWAFGGRGHRSGREVSVKGKIALLMLLADVAFGIPFLPFIIVLSAFLDPSIWNVVLAMAALLWRDSSRVIRAQVLVIREQAFVSAARVSGASHLRIVFLYIAPSILPLTFLYGSLAIGWAILTEASVSFLGFGDPNVVSWGYMLQDAFLSQAMSRGAFCWFIPPGVCIMLTVMAGFFIGRGYEEILFPRLRRQ
jgi:hypothetical protein